MEKKEVFIRLMELSHEKTNREIKESRKACNDASECFAKYKERVLKGD